MIDTVTLPKEQNISVTYDANGNHPRVTFSFKGTWAAKRNGQWAANGDYEFVLDVGTGRKGPPKKLFLNGIVCEEITPEERGPLARKIKEQLKPQIVAILERVNGDVRRQIHKLW